MCDDLKGLVSVFFTFFVMPAYMVVCMEFPREPRCDPWWLCIIKSWGFILLLLVSFFAPWCLLTYFCG